MPDFEKQKLRSRFEAKLLDAGAADVHAAYGDRKTEVIGSMTGTIVELGPGTGPNMRYYAPGVKVIAIEPNPHMHDRLQEQAEQHGVDLEIRSLRGEAVDVDDATADGVVGTLLLCGVEDPALVVAEAHRLLKSGGVYFFTEHVRSPDSSRTRKIQKVLKRPHQWMFNGCRIDQPTADILRSGPFDQVEIDEIDRGRGGIWVRHQIVGTATKTS